MSSTSFPVKFIERIGSGSQGEVYRGYHMLLQRECAIKRMNSPRIATKEARVLKYIRKKCPNAVEFIDHIVHEDHNYIIMEYIHGINGRHLLDLTHKGIYMTEDEVAKIVWHMARTLQYLHEHEYVYGDIKPDNFIYMPPNNICMIDFGCARDGPELYTPVGTPIYFSPEKFQWNFGYASDIWALGVVMYLFLCGVHPFAHQYRRKMDRYMLEHEICNNPLAFTHPKWDDVSKEAQDLLYCMLIKDPKHRITANEILEHPWFLRVLKKK